MSWPKQSSLDVSSKSQVEFDAALKLAEAQAQHFVQVAESQRRPMCLIPPGEYT